MIPHTRIEESPELHLIKEQTYINHQTGRQCLTPLGRTILFATLGRAKEALRAIETTTLPWEWLGRYDLVLKEHRYNVCVWEKLKKVFQPQEREYTKEEVNQIYERESWRKDDITLLVKSAYHGIGKERLFAPMQVERIRREAINHPELSFETSVLFLDDIVNQREQPATKLLESALSLLTIAVKEDPEDYNGGQFALSLIANLFENPEITPLFRKFVPTARAGYFPEVECGSNFAFKVVSTDEALRMEWVASIKEYPRTTWGRIAHRGGYTHHSSQEEFEETAQRIEMIRNHEGTAECHYGFSLTPPVNTFPISREKVLVAMRMDEENLDVLYKKNPSREDFYRITEYVLTELTRFHVTLTEHVDYKDGKFVYALEHSWPIEPASSPYEEKRRSVQDKATKQPNEFINHSRNGTIRSALHELEDARRLWFPKEKTDTYALGTIPLLDYKSRLLHCIVGDNGERVGKNKKLDNLIKKLRPIIEFIQSGPLTVCMGDCYDTNILKSGRLCDLELVMANPFYDFANFIGEPSKDVRDKAAFVAQIIDEFGWSHDLHVTYSGRIIKDPSVMIDPHQSERHEWIRKWNKRRKGKFEYANPAEQANFERFSAALCGYSIIKDRPYNDDQLFGFFKACEIINSMGEFGSNFNRAFLISTSDEQKKEGERKATYHLQNSLRLTHHQMPVLYRAWKAYLKESGNQFIITALESTDYKTPDPITAESVGEEMKYRCDQYNFGKNRITSRTLSDCITEQTQPAARR